MATEKDPNPDPPRKKPLPPRSGVPRPPIPPPTGLLRREETGLMEYLRRRMEIMERELVKERERSMAAENLIKQQQALRGEVEHQLKEIAGQIKREKTVRDLENEKEAAHGRIDSLEKRLDEMHHTWAGLIREAVAKHEKAGASTTEEVASLSDLLGRLQNAVETIRTDLAPMKAELAGLPALASELQSMNESLPAESRQRAKEERALRDHVRDVIDGYQAGLMERLSALDKRLTVEFEDHHERLSALARERESLREMMDEQRHQIREEYLKERVLLENQFKSQLEELQDAIGSMGERQAGTASALSGIETLTKKLHEHLTRPSKAKDQAIADLEEEKRDLMLALKQRTEQLRAYTLERREVERTLGESLMDLNRQLEAEKSRQRQTDSQFSSLQNTIDALRGKLDIMEQASQDKDARFQQLAAERDRLVEALTEEAAKVRGQIAARTESDKGWEAKVLDMQRLVNDERQLRLQAEAAVSELRAQTATFSDHISRVLREKESTDKRFESWNQEREELLEKLRKKDEMVSMLSNTFQNLLKKPGTDLPTP